MKKLLDFSFRACFCLIASVVLFCLVSCETPKKENNHRTIGEMVEHLKKSGLEIENARLLVSDAVKAESGIALKISGKEVGIYKFDTNLKKMKDRVEKIEANGFIYVVGFKYPVIVNGSFILFDFDKNPEKDKIIKAFNSF